MKFGIHNPSWLFGSDQYEIFEEVKRKAQWADARLHLVFIDGSSHSNPRRGCRR
jgi:hypothetical protein